MLLVAPLEREVVTAMKDIERSVVPDLPDRVIAATAHALRVPLITKDARIWKSAVDTIW
jgi:PIN domain nuclease of toxin-antitoxin system